MQAIIYLHTNKQTKPNKIITKFLVNIIELNYIMLYR